MEWFGNSVNCPDFVLEYLQRVKTVDTAEGDSRDLEPGVVYAISNCLQSLVADGILGVSGGVLSQSASLIKAACFMQGARTLSGALVPLAADMPAPMNFNFAAGDYNRRTGLLGNGVNKLLKSNRLVNSDPQDDCHLAAYVTQADTQNQAGSFPALIGCQRDGAPYDGNALFYTQLGATLLAQTRRAGGAQVFPTRATTGFAGISRASSAQETARGNGVTTTVNATSVASQNNNILVFNYGLGMNSNPTNFTNARLNFYSIGRALDLAILDARITALSLSIQSVIP